jgi:hypothetical protein
MGGMNKPIQIFKPGKHVAMNGAALSFSESDLAATAAAYDPSKHEAPIVIGHPKHDGPAYGWVKSLAFADGLDADPHQVDPAFAEMVERGAFKKISASFYSPDSPSNPVPGVYYLRHVGFLGAQPPAVKGLRNPEFADAEEGVVEFADWGDVQNASILRSLRDWIIGKFGQDEADKAIPGYAVQTVEQEVNKEDAPESAVAVAPAFTEPQPEGETMSDADKARLAALETENAALKAKEVAFAEAEKKRAADARHAEHVAFAEGLIAEGKLLPAYKDSVVANMDFVGGQESVVEFGEGDVKQPLIDAYKAFLLAQPKQVDFGEASGADKGESIDFSDPVELAKFIVEFQEAEAKAGRTVSATDALQQLKKGK